MGLQADFNLWTTRETIKAELAKIKPAASAHNAFREQLSRFGDAGVGYLLIPYQQ